MNGSTPTSNTPQLPETIEIDDLDQFVKILSAWHGNKVQLLNHMLSVPEDAEIEIDGQTHVMAGDFRRGYLAGLNLALIELGTLPFGAELETSHEQLN